MTVKFSDKAEAYVQEIMREGGHGNAEQAADLLILKQRADDCYDAENPPLTPEQLKSSLLAAVGKPTRPYRKGEFGELTRRAVVEKTDV